MEKKDKISIRIDEETKKVLKILAIKKNLNLSKYIQLILYEHIRDSPDIETINKKMAKSELLLLEIDDLKEKLKLNHSNAFLVSRTIETTKKFLVAQASPIYVTKQIKIAFELFKKSDDALDNFRKFLPFLQDASKQKAWEYYKQELVSWCDVVKAELVAVTTKTRNKTGDKEV